jgi:hypothetical protein
MRAISSPRIDWSWQRAARILDGKVARDSDADVSPRASTLAYGLSWMLPHVALPHVVTFVIGTTLFLLGFTNHLPGFSLGVSVSVLQM